MKILADNQIPLLEHFFADRGEVLALPFQEINSKSLQGVDILLTRSQFKVDQALLEDSSLKFIGSCVTGTDHLDRDYLERRKIPFYAAEGCNTQSVVEYTLSVIAALIEDKILSGPPFPKEGIRAGIVGLGRIGSRLRKIFSTLGWKLYLYDPFLFDSSLECFKDLDLISLHTPLTRSGPYPTFHLFDKKLMERQKEGCVLINTSRGAVVNTADLLKYGGHLVSCLDVWEHEPDIDLSLLKQTYIATPHIAGHSVQGKQRGTEYVYQAAAKRFNWPAKTMPLNRRSMQFSDMRSWQELILKLMDPRKESARMKAAIGNTDSIGPTFSTLRKTYPERYELGFIDNIPADIPGIWDLI